MSYSVLFSEPIQCETQQPPCFQDLNLDRFLTAVLKNESRIDLSGFFYTPLPDVAQVYYRQEIQKDLLKGENLSIAESFTSQICALADFQAKALEDLNSKDPWRCTYLLYGHILDRTEQYVKLTQSMLGQISQLSLTSEGLTEAAQGLKTLCESDFYRNLKQSQERLRSRFDGLQYCMQIKYGTVRVKKYEGEADLSKKILSVFEKFSQDDRAPIKEPMKEAPYADHVEANILQCLSRLYPEQFQALTDYCRRFCQFVDPGLLRFCRELRFYIDWLQRIRPMKDWGLPFCFPSFSQDEQFSQDFFDLVLADKIGNSVVRNDFVRHPGEQFLVITGPNQGGKTTFARALGQLHWLASLGLCIPGTAACLQLTDRVLTHFEQDEGAQPRSGRLHGDLTRLQALLDQASPDSLVIINEIFASTSAENALELGRKMLDSLTEKGSLTLVVTFLTELSQYSPAAVSLTGTVDPEDPARRTYRVVRKPADGQTYARTLAQKHRLTYDQIIRRISPCL